MIGEVEGVGEAMDMTRTPAVATMMETVVVAISAVAVATEGTVVKAMEDERGVSGLRDSPLEEGVGHFRVFKST